MSGACAGIGVPQPCSGFRVPGSGGVGVSGSCAGFRTAGPCAGVRVVCRLSGVRAVWRFPRVPAVRRTEPHRDVFTASRPAPGPECRASAVRGAGRRVPGAYRSAPGVHGDARVRVSAGPPAVGRTAAPWPPAATDMGAPRRHPRLRCTTAASRLARPGGMRTWCGETPRPAFRLPVEAAVTRRRGVDPVTPEEACGGLLAGWRVVRGNGDPLREHPWSAPLDEDRGTRGRAVRAPGGRLRRTPRRALRKEARRTSAARFGADAASLRCGVSRGRVGRAEGEGAGNECRRTCS